MSLRFFILLTIFLAASNAQLETGAENNQLLQNLYEARTSRRGNWKEVTEAFGITTYKWNTTLPTNTLVNETAYLAESKNILLMKSRDRDLKNEGFDKSTTLIDFETGMIAFRTKFPATSDVPGAPAAGEQEGMTRRERRRKLREFFAGRDRACFITTTGVTLADAKTELQNRVSNSPVPTGTAQRFVAEEMNRISTAELTKLNHKIAKFCTKAGQHSNHFRLVADSMATTHKDNLVVMGQFDTTQKTMSIPYEIHVEQSIINGIRTPLSETAAEP